MTKDDILEFIARAAAPGSAPAAAPALTPATAPRQTPTPPAAPGADQVQPMSVMRKRIAEHLIASRRTSAHVHSVFEVSFARVARVREAKKSEQENAGAKISYMSFIIKAAADALRAVPVVNASIDGDNVVYHRDVNIGVAVALDWGLIVPVIKSGRPAGPARHQPFGGRSGEPRVSTAQADESRRTFTITNPGVFGALSGTPIINQPQVAILGVGAIEKRPVVIDDAIAFD